MASRSMMSGFFAVHPWSGAWDPARSHARSRTQARALLMARTALSASPARVWITRETVGSEATRP